MADPQHPTDPLVGVDLGAGTQALRQALTDLGDATGTLTDYALLAPSRLYGWSVLDVLTHAVLTLQHLHDLTDTTVQTANLSSGSFLRTITCLGQPRDGHLGQVDSSQPIAELLRIRRVAAGYRDPEYLLAHLHVTLRGVHDLIGRLGRTEPDPQTTTLRPGPCVGTAAGVVRVADACIAWAAEITAWQRIIMGVTSGLVVSAPHRTADELAHLAFAAASRRSAWESLHCHLPAPSATSSPHAAWTPTPLADPLIPVVTHTQHRPPHRTAALPHSRVR